MWGTILLRQWIKSPKAFVIPLYIWTFLSGRGQRWLGFLKHLPACITRHRFPHLRENLRAEEVPLLKLKRKNKPPSPWFLLPPKYQSGAITSLGGSRTKAGLLQKGPLRLHSFPYPREFGGRGWERLPLRPCQALVIGVAETSWGREIEREILRGKKRGCPRGKEGPMKRRIRTGSKTHRKEGRGGEIFSVSVPLPPHQRQVLAIT